MIRNSFLYLLILVCISACQTKNQTESQLQVKSIQNEFDLDGIWLAKKLNDTPLTGQQITSGVFDSTGWINATVPGTILPDLVNAGIYPDPYIGVNNIDSGFGVTLPVYIPDLWDKWQDGDSSFYTFWYYTEFELPALKPGQHAWIEFRGINYSADIYLNGQNVTHHLESMFLRHNLDISPAVSGANRLAVLVRPPKPLNPGTFDSRGNGGVPGQEWIDITDKYPVGWDWITPTRHRNAGIWDRVKSKITGPVVIRNPHIVTSFPSGDYSSANIDMTIETYNVSSVTQTGSVVVQSDEGGFSNSGSFSIPAHSSILLSFPTVNISDPDLWWPNGYGDQALYDAGFSAVLSSSDTSDQITEHFGIRHIQADVVSYSAQHGLTFTINGKKIFIRGGNWISTDAMLRYSEKRYDDEVRFHRDMNLNMIRVWGGGIAERPEFYDACDKYGILVMQDFWVSGEQQNNPPTGLYLKSIRGRIKLLRNHPSLCFWNGGNEQMPPAGINDSTQCYVEGNSGVPCTGVPILDGTRIYVSSSISSNDGLGPSDGPYGILDLESIYNGNYGTATGTAFNPEIGSVGMVTAESIKEMMGNDPSLHTLPDGCSSAVNDGMKLHKYQRYCDPAMNDMINNYGIPTTIDQYCGQAQLANYNQYRALFEGYNIRMWKYNSGALIWKSQNPWPALRSQLYDWFLEPTGGYFGVMHAAEPVHVQLDLSKNEIGIVNNSSEILTLNQLSAQIIDANGKSLDTVYSFTGTVNDNGYTPTNVYVPKPVRFDTLYFVELNLIYTVNGNTDTSSNFYWLSSTGKFTGLRNIPTTSLNMVSNHQLNSGIYTYQVELTNTGNRIAFWNRIEVKNLASGNRILPVFYSDNYISLFPGATRVIQLGFSASDVDPGDQPKIMLTGWNL